MRESPRLRRLRSDLRAISQLKTDSTILDFECRGNPPEWYLLRFQGLGLWRPEGRETVLMRSIHEVSLGLGASYPRMMPELSWKTPIFHPNISASGVVCLGGYGTYWVPSVNLDELCHMLWDMARYQNFDVNSPYNREAALWAKTQREVRLPVDPRPLRDRVAGMASPAPVISAQSVKRPPVHQPTATQPHFVPPRRPDPVPEVIFLDSVPEPIGARAGVNEGEIVFLE